MARVTRALVLLLGVLLLSEAAAPGASRPAGEQAKIEWLLKEIGDSKAVFIRNGKEYEAGKAVSHLKTKLLFAGSRVQTARQFIVGVASHSEETGKPYEIRPPDGNQQKLEIWLLGRLAVYEKGEKASKN